jgi:hypothetical protein
MLTPDHRDEGRFARITSPVDSRTRTRTAKEAHAAALAALNRDRNDVVNDDDADDGSLRNNILR